MKHLGKFKPNALSSLIMLALGSFSGSAFADDKTATEEQIEKVTVHGQKLNGVDLVDLGDIQKKQANDLEDIFRGEPDITVGGSFGIAQKVYVRGIEDTNLNVTVDGATQAGYLFHHQGRLSIEPEMLKRVEVKAGAGTALDGAGALGGAIRFITKDADDLLDGDERFGTLVKAGYFSNTKGKKYSANVYGRFTDDWSGLLIVGKNDTGNIKDGNGNQLANTKTDQEIGLAKIKGKLTDTQTITLSHEIRNDDGYRNVRPHFGAEEWNRANNQKSRRKTSTLNYFYEPASDFVTLKFTAFKTDAYLTQNENNAKRDGAGVKSTGGDLRNGSRLGEHYITYGVDYRKDTGYYINPSKEEKGSVLGLYVQDLFEVNNDISLSFGARFDRYKLDDADSQHYSASGVSPNISAIYQLNDKFEIRAGYSSALRGQKIKEAYLIGFRKNHKDLKEETAKNYEVGVSFNDNGYSLNAKAYVTKIDDVVGTVGTRATGRFFGNLGDLKTKGFTVSAAKKWEQLRVGLNYSQNKPEVDGKPLNDGTMGIGTSSGDTLTAQVNYNFDEIDLELGWNGRFVKRLDRVRAGNPSKTGFGVHDLYAEWYPLDSDSLSVNLSINNLLDKQFYDHGTFGYDSDEKKIIGLPEAGRDFRLTLGYKF
ncbi:MAG: TonB-dependent receptor domain-containing protein [Parashewanella sp.]